MGTHQKSEIGRTKTPESDARQPFSVLRAHFSDGDELTDAAPAWSLDFRQLDPGPGLCEVEQVLARDVAVARFALGARFHQSGASMPGMRDFAIAARESSRLRWCGQEVGPESLLSFPRNGQFDAASFQGFRMNVVSIREDDLAACLAANQISADDVMSGSRPRVLELPAAVGDRLRRAVGRLVESPARGGELSSRATAEIARALAASIPGAESQGEARYALIRRATSIMQDRRADDPRISDICEELGVTTRALQYAFLAWYGVSPKRYLKSLRLQGVRRELVRMPAGSKVSDVANHWGFWHMGQFAADFRNQFGELPSESLQRRNRS